MATSCAEYLVMRVFLEVVDSHGHIMTGNIGEEIANDIGIKKLGMSSTGFRAAKHGLDGVLRDKEGNMVVVESKTTTGNPFSGLKINSRVTQASNEWVQRKVDCMQRTESSQSQGKNPEIAKEIQRSLDQEKLRCILVHTNPETSVVKAYERVSDMNVRRSSGWKLLGTWKG